MELIREILAILGQLEQWPRTFLTDRQTDRQMTDTEQDIQYSTHTRTPESYSHSTVSYRYFRRGYQVTLSRR